MVDSNIVFEEPRDRVMARWLSLVERLYEPAALIARYRRSFARILPNRLSLPRRRPTPAQVMLGLYALAATTYFVLLRSRYRRAFAPLGLDLLRGRHVDSLINAASVSYHMIKYREEAMVIGAQPCIHTEAVAFTERAAGSPASEVTASNAG